MPTKHRRHAITETGAVADALKALRAEVGPDGFTVSELVLLGAQRKLFEVRARRAGSDRALRELTTMVRARSIPVDVAAADEVRRTGWVREA